MTMATVEAVTNRFMVPYAPEAHGARTTIICADERGAALEGLQLAITDASGQSRVTLDRTNPRHADETRYLRTIAGAVGIGQDLHVTMRILQEDALRPGHSDIPRLSPQTLTSADHRQGRVGSLPSIPKAHILSSIIAKAASVEGIDICNHVGCAGETLAPVIAIGIGDNRGKEGENIRDLIMPHWRNGERNFDRALFERIRETFAGAAEEDGGMFAPLEESVPLLDRGGVHESRRLDPVARVPIARMDHVSDTMIVDWVRGRTLDAHAATVATRETEMREVWTHYYASMGDVPGIVGQVALDHIVATDDPQKFLRILEMVSFVRNTATSSWLPKQNGRPPQLHTLSTLN